jgi:hypothetical protein
MPVKVFQVDQSARLMPYAYEQEAIRAAGGDFIIDNCASEAEVVERAQGPRSSSSPGRGTSHRRRWTPCHGAA